MTAAAARSYCQNDCNKDYGRKLTEGGVELKDKVKRFLEEWNTMWEPSYFVQVEKVVYSLFVIARLLECERESETTEWKF